MYENIILLYENNATIFKYDMMTNFTYSEYYVDSYPTANWIKLLHIIYFFLQINIIFINSFFLINQVRTRGGNKKYRALRLDTGNFSWGSECTTRKTRIIDVVYNASNNELVRTKTLVKNAIVTIDATPFRQWYEGHYVLPLGRKRGAKLVSE